MPISNKALKGYIYRDPQAPNPLTLGEQYEGKITDPRRTPLYFTYYSDLGKESDPNAYINSEGESIVDLAWLVSMDTDNPTKKLKEFGKKNYRSKESMIKQFTDVTRCEIYDIPNGVVTSRWQSESDDEWRGKYHADKSYPSPQHMWLDYTYDYAAWRRGESYRGKVIDVPGEPDSAEAQVIEVQSESDVPRGELFKDYPKVETGEWGRKRKVELMEKDMRDARKRDDRRYYISNAWGSGLTEAQVKELGIENIDDMPVDATKRYSTKSGVSFTITRSKNIRQEPKYVQRRKRFGLRGR